MECPIQARVQAEVLLDYCAHRLNPQAAAVLERHFEHCAACTAWVESQKAVWTALDAWEAAPVSADFDRQLYRRMQAEERPAWWRALLGPLAGLNLRPALSLAVASALALAVFLMRAPTSNEISPHQAQVETLDADRLERALDDVEMLRQLNLVPATDSQSM